MKNVTITLDEEVANWARVWAAQHNMSVSRLVGKLLHGYMDEEMSYPAAMADFLSHPPQKLCPSGVGYPSKDDLHDRQNLR